MCKTKKVAGRILRCLVLGVCLSAIWGVTLSTARAQPTNDNFAEAEEISGQTGTAFGSNFDATSEPDEPVHVGIPTDAGASVWYRWTAPSDGAISFDTVGSDF